MRIAIVSWNRRKLGGAEAYIEEVISELDREDNEVAFCYGIDEPKTASQISVPVSAPTWCVSELGEQAVLTALRNWKPDVIYAHGLKDAKLEAEVLNIAPAVFFAHSYYGTCISGSKTFSFPKVHPCDRRFGKKCLAHYYPHRCGGLNPFTMWREYERQQVRLKLLERYRAIVTLSDHMANEYINHGFDPKCVHNLSSYVNREISRLDLTFDHANLRADISDDEAAHPPPPDDAYYLLFLGRMDYLKGGRLFCASLLKVCAGLNRPVRVTFAGDGPDRTIWEQKASPLNGLSDKLRIEFVGWVSAQRREELLRRSHLLVVPSLWPEPFGMVGLEAGLLSVPAVAFDVGGIREWLRSGINGFLASGNPATADGLAAAIVKCFESPTAYAALRRGALAVGLAFNQRLHVLGLLSVLRRATTD